MNDALVSALQITVIGMTLLFLTLGFFYGLLSLITAVIRDRPGVLRTADEEPTRKLDDVADAALAAAAVAVALARSEVDQEIVRQYLGAGERSRGETDPWWSLHHERRLTLNPDTRRRR
jgi:Na+-transporting methylmalonyl-CoA/oxaloacetate decarboxylase gamma subunit